jgi:carbamoyltransferase
VPAFPGDECIGFGVASFLKYVVGNESYQILPFENQHAYFGPLSSVPKRSEIEKTFSSAEYLIQYSENIESETAKKLADGKIIAWFQGRSESGPRALGNRSILVRPDRSEIKNYLNANIKFREAFRPYGCSVLWEKSHEYFDIEQGFNNPYMSYAIKVREAYKDILKDVSHVDGTSRMQTVRTGQNEKFHKLILEFGKITNLYCLLNTSLNVMDEPILETVEDAKKFIDQSDVDFLVIDNFMIKRMRNEK